MKLNQIIAMANSAYPIRGQINRHWDNKNQRVKVYADDGQNDTLALFIVRELKETYDENLSDIDQLRAARGTIDKAVCDATAVRNRFARAVMQTHVKNNLKKITQGMKSS